MRYVFLGLSITSSWGNGHATTYRSLLRALAARGHEVTFLERDLPFYAENRDLPSPGFATTHLYGSLEELDDRFAGEVSEADLVVVGSYVPDGVRVGNWALDRAPGRAAFYDIDTPITLDGLKNGRTDYLELAQIPRYALYLSFTSGPILGRLERELGSPCARALHCSVDPELYYPEERPVAWDLGYLGTFSTDRQPVVDRLLVEPARALAGNAFVVYGPQYPATLSWPANVERRDHLAPDQHRQFYAAQRYTLNVTRAAMVAAGYSPSVRLFEAGACGTPIISDRWRGLDELFVPGSEILIAETTADVVRMLGEISDEQRRAIGARARKRVLAEHTSDHRAEALERYTAAVLAERKTASNGVIHAGAPAHASTL